MREQLRPELRTVRQLFDDDDAIYTVPIYQRNYAWGAEQIEQLTRDVIDAMTDGEDGYFLGNLVVVNRASEGAPKYEVIDGQQRLTTLYLLLTLLSAHGSGGWSAHRDRLQYESRTRATEALRKVATSTTTRGGEAGSTSGEDTGILAGLNAARQCLQQQFTAKGQQAASERNIWLDSFSDYLHDRVTLVRASLPGSTDLNKYFEVMNTRGQQLAQVDIVKARLMSRLTDDPTAQACLARVWDACADMDSYVQMTLTRAEPELRSRIFGNDWTWLQAQGWADLQECLQSDCSSASGVAAGSRTLDDALRVYATQGEDVQPYDDDNVRFRSTIEFPVFLLHALKVLTTDPESGLEDDADRERLLDDKKLIKRFDGALGSSSAAEVTQFVFDLLRLRNLFDAFVLKRQYTARTGDDGDWSLQRLVKQTSGTKTTAGYRNSLATGATATEEEVSDEATRELLLLQSMLRVTYTSPRTMHWITQLLTHLADTPSPDTAGRDSIALLRNYGRSQVRSSYLDMKTRPTGFAINRIVFTYLDYLYLLRANPADRASYRFGFRNSIEHFYPQQPDQEQHGAHVSPENLHVLGNLALVSIGTNSKFSNSLPAVKAGNFPDIIEKQSPKLHRMAELTQEMGWGDEQVRQHHAELEAMLHNDQAGLPQR